MFTNSKSKKILSEIKTIDLIPVAKHKHKLNEENRLVILIPKFKNEKFARWFIPRNKSIYYSVKLDEIGSMVYSKIDNKSSVKQICETISSSNSDVVIENLEERVCKFISNMYRYRFITFKQLTDHGLK